MVINQYIHQLQNANNICLHAIGMVQRDAQAEDVIHILVYNKLVQKLQLLDHLAGQ